MKTIQVLKHSAKEGKNNLRTFGLAKQAYTSGRISFFELCDVEFILSLYHQFFTPKSIHSV